jgi:class 3 adenylate cyclase/tetratricopeptide (TPR) repeat protein
MVAGDLSHGHGIQFFRNVYSLFALGSKTRTPTGSVICHFPPLGSLVYSWCPYHVMPCLFRLCYPLAEVAEGRGGSAVNFEEILDQALAMLRRRGRVTYRTLRRQFDLDEETLEDLKAELIEAQQVAADEGGTVLVWTGGNATAAVPTGDQGRAVQTYTPPHLVEKIITSKAALEGERKQVTVLFADMKSSLELLADRDPEEARQVLDAVVERMMAAVHRYEGTVNQIMGDGIMALFGAPIAHEDHAVRACYAALTMQEAIARYNEAARRSHGNEVRIRVGLNSGEVVVRAIGNDLHMDYSAIGQTTHLAARMEQLADPGSIRLTAETYRLAEGFIQVNPLGPVPVRGLTTPMEAFELVGVTAVRRRLQAAAARGLTHFLGRQTEFELLRQALQRAGAGHGQVVAMVGEAGVGKSRLVYEFLRAHHTRTWRVLESISVSYGKATSYYPVIDLLKRYFEIKDDDDPRTIRARVTGHLLTLDASLQEEIPAFLALLEALEEDSPFLQLEPPRRRQRILGALKRMLLRESQVQPLVLVFEDLHWIDTETQALLDSLVESLATARLLLLVNYRPEYQHDWGSKTYYTQLRLDPFPPESAEELLRVALGDEASLGPLKRMLIDRTQGNPFFLEESVHALVETEILVGEPGAYRLARSLDNLQMPATVQAVLAARIDRLPPEEKRLLQTAAVIGTEVPFPLLQAIAELPEAVLHRGLSHLLATEFLYETHLFPELVYTFKHALTHEVAYGSLLQERRRALHARIVDALEALFPERLAEQVERLAHHALRGEVWDKAVTYCRQAGARAYNRSALHETVTWFDRTLEALSHLPESPERAALAIDLRLDLGLVLFPLEEFGRLLTHLQEAEALARALDDRVRLTQVLARMAHVCRGAGDADGSITAGQQALAIATDIGDRALQARASLHLGQAYVGSGNFIQGAALLRQSVETLGEESGIGDPQLRPHAQAWLARTLSYLGEFAEGRHYGEEALRLTMVEGRRGVSIIAHGCLGLLYLAQGDLEAAIQIFEQGLALCRAAGNRDWSNPIASGLGCAYALTGRIAEGLALLEEANREDILRTGVLHRYCLRLSWLSEVCLLAGRHEEAQQHACQALDLARRQKARGDEALARRALGAVHAHADPPEVRRAESLFREALALAQTLGMRPTIAHCHLGLGTLYLTCDRQDNAHAELSAAIELYRSMAMKFWLPQAEAGLKEIDRP